MKIAFISFEYPPDTAYGGIATYVEQAANMLQKKGHQVEVFTASPHRQGTEKERNGLIVHRLKISQRVDFSLAVAKVFSQRHQNIQFDVLEGPEFGGDALFAVKAVPSIPFVVKLHTPRIIMGEYSPGNLLNKLRISLGEVRRGLNPFQDREHLSVLAADVIASPSLAITKEIIKLWSIDSQKIDYFPLPYTPSAELLNIPIETDTNTVTFVGLLSIRKGVLDLIKAIPLIIKKIPQVQFRFVGGFGPSPDPKRNMKEYITKLIAPYANNIEVTGKVPLDKIPFYLGKTDVCVFPSHWESFGMVCLEAMAAGRGVIGSSAGGMAEIINSPEVGRLVPPHSPESIALAVTKLLENPSLRWKLGRLARKRVLEEYNIERIGALQEASYLQAIENKKKS